MNISELVDETAAAALAHAAALQSRLRDAGAANQDAALRECDDEIHRLIGDIVSLRNAAELLRRAQPAS